ncbi:MAG: hypothetical protein LBG77_03915, partial [Dysgonamonadaceae bacterium]|nr:hypothetical protein [Dysgonamonadaceae bacterium]
MITLKLTRNEVYSWRHKNDIYVKGYLFTPDGILHKDADLCNYFENTTTEYAFQQKLLSANGTFSVIIKQPDQSLWMAVDRYRYFPLFYRKKGVDLIVSDEIADLYEPDESKTIDESALLSFRGLGYVAGNKTLLKDAFQIQSGEYIVYDDNRITPTFYHQHFSEIVDISFDEAKIQLKEILQNVGQRMSKLLNGRPALLPLSGGYDSRLIACLLNKEGVKNVLCFTYGKKAENPEWKRSQTVAEKL